MVGKLIFVTIKLTIDAVKFSNTIQLSPFSMLNIKMYSCISLGLKITQIRILRNVVDDFGT
jgi:hypothetical protein